MENTFDISIILPINSSKSKDFDEFFKKAIESIKIQSVKPKELVLVHSKEESLITYLNEFDFSDINVVKIKNEGETDFSSQMNLGIKSATSKWICFFEFDDEFSGIWLKNLKKYSESYPEVESFMPIVIDVDSKNAFAGFTNEATFAANFAQEIGYLTNDMLHNYQNFQTAGMAINKSTLEDFGGFKPSIKLTFIYEFLLRMTYNSVKIMTIPRIGYKHINMRHDSLFWDYKFGENKITEDEAKFWLSTAKKEYFFVDDRNIKYSEMV